MKAILSIVIVGPLFLTYSSPAVAAESKTNAYRQITNSIGMKLTLIPSGEFMMGSKESPDETAAFINQHYPDDVQVPNFFTDEHPRHRVRITRAFYLGTYHVTRGQFRKFVLSARYKTDAEKSAKPGAFGWNPERTGFGFNKNSSWRDVGFEQTDDHPVVDISWNDAIAFCKWLSRKEGQTYRLPTEAEWEYACRAGTTTRYYSGNDPESLARVGNVADAAAKTKFPDWNGTIKASDGYIFTSPAGSFQPNAFGLYDMHGDAWQWCSDWYGEEYYATSPKDDPIGPDSGGGRVIRGGSWNSRPTLARSAERVKQTPDDRDFLTGFRVAKTE
jgi:formylglycine-generating enzyme